MRGWSGDAMVLGKLPVPGRPADLDESRARAYCARSSFQFKKNLYGKNLILFYKCFEITFH